MSHGFCLLDEIGVDHHALSRREESWDVHGIRRATVFELLGGPHFDCAREIQPRNEHKSNRRFVWGRRGGEGAVVETFFESCFGNPRERRKCSHSCRSVRTCSFLKKRRIGVRSRPTPVTAKRSSEKNNNNVCLNDQTRRFLLFFIVSYDFVSRSLPIEPLNVAGYHSHRLGRCSSCLRYVWGQRGDGFTHTAPVHVQAFTYIRTQAKHS